MVKKLIKYDFRAFAKVMVPVELVLLGVALLYRVMSFFESDNAIYRTFDTSAVIILIISCVAAFFTSFFFSVVRFYRNLFTAEGYLSFTLPVTPAAHIASKLIVSLIFDVITVVSIFAAVAVATAGEVFAEIVKAVLYLFERASSIVGGQMPLYIIEAIVLAVVFVSAAHLLTYMCVSVGQLANKHKILLALGVYFAVYVVKQLISTTFLATGTATGGIQNIMKYIAENRKLSLHLILSGAILIELVLGAVYWIVSNALMKKKLNLE